MRAILSPDGRVRGTGRQRPTASRATAGVSRRLRSSDTRNLD